LDVIVDVKTTRCQHGYYKKSAPKNPSLSNKKTSFF